MNSFTTREDKEALQQASYDIGFEEGYRKCLDDKEPSMKSNMEKVAVIKIAAENYFGMTIEQMGVNKKTTELVTARQVTMYLLTKYTKLSLKGIGRMFGNRDHTTVIHSRDIVTDHLQAKDEIITKAVMVLETQI